MDIPVQFCSAYLIKDASLPLSLELGKGLGEQAPRGLGLSSTWAGRSDWPCRTPTALPPLFYKSEQRQLGVRVSFSFAYLWGQLLTV